MPEERVSLHGALEKLRPPLDDLEVGEGALLHASLPLLVRFDVPNETDRIIQFFLVLVPFLAAFWQMAEKLEFPVK